MQPRPKKEMQFLFVFLAVNELKSPDVISAIQRLHSLLYSLVGALVTTNWVVFLLDTSLENWLFCFYLEGRFYSITKFLPDFQIWATQPVIEFQPLLYNKYKTPVNLGIVPKTQTHQRMLALDSNPIYHSILFYSYLDYVRGDSWTLLHRRHCY